MSKDFDVVIMGGGVIGCSSALFLAARPDFHGSIAVIERDPTYQNSPSAKSTGGFRQQFSTPENIEMGLFGAHFIKNIGEFLSVDMQVPDVSFKENGYLLIATENALPIMVENNELQRELGANIEQLPPSKLKQRFPWLNTQRVAAGFHGVENEGWVDPYSLLQAYRRKARSLGVDFIHDEVIDVKTDGLVVTEIELAATEALQVGAVINAAGAAGIRTLANSVGLHLPIESRKRHTFVFDVRAEIKNAPLTIFPEQLTFRPEGAHFITNMAPPRERDPDTNSTDVEHDLFEDICWPVLASWVPAFEAIKLKGGWCCHYDVNLLDENAIIDRHPTLQNYFFATGFSGHGLQQSPAIGRAMSELVVTGAFETLDLRRFGLTRVTNNQPIVESNCY